jgi:hypothetical protein
MGFFRKKKKVNQIRENAKQGKETEDLFRFRMGLESEDEVKRKKTPDFETGEFGDEVKSGDSPLSSDQKEDQKKRGKKFRVWRKKDPDNLLDTHAFDQYAKDDDEEEDT